MHRTTKAASVLAAMTLAVSLTACGSDDEETSAGGENGASAPAEDSGGDDSDSDDGDGADDADTSAYCDEYESLMGNQALAGFDPMEDPSGAGEMIDTLAAVAEAAPSDVQSDWDAVVSALETASEIDVSDPEAMNDPEVQEKLKGLAEMEVNFENIGEHAEQECGLELSATQGPDSP